MKTNEARRALWLHGILTWKLHESQLVIDQGIESLPANVHEAVMLCCRRFGKSFYGCVRSLSRAIQARQKKVLRIIGPDIKQTKMIVEYNMAKITEELHELNLTKLVRWVKSENMYEIGDHAGLFLGGFDSQADSLRGGEAHEILIEESGSSDPDQYDYQMRSVIKPQLLKTNGMMIHLTTLPPVPDHPFINETIPQAKLDNAFYSYTIYEDPLATPEIIERAIKDSGGINSEPFRREYLNEIIRDRNIVIIPDYNERIHVKSFTTPPRVHYEIYTDWGGVRDFTVSLLMGYDFLRARDLVFDEIWWPANTPTEIINRDIKAKWSDYDIKRHYVDAPGQLQVDLMYTHKMDIQQTEKGDWEANINALANRFTNNKIEIHPRCKLLRQTCASGQFNKHRTDFARSNALGHMDAIAALMYGNRQLDRTSPYPPQSTEHDFMYIPADQMNRPQEPATARKSFLKDPHIKVFK